MAGTLRIKMFNKQAEFDLTGDSITECSIKNGFLLPNDAVVSLSYDMNGCQKLCQSRIVPEPCFLLPVDWQTMQFNVQSDRVPLRPSTPMDQNERPISPYYPVLPPEPAPSSEAFIQWMFYLHDQLHGKATTICVHPHFFVTFRHGTHQKFNLKDTMKIYRAQEEIGEENGIEVSVVNINEPLDFVLLKSQFDVVKFGPPIDHPRESEPFTLVGFGNDPGYISYLPGAIHHVRNYSFHNDDRKMGPFILGNCASSRAHSGAGIWGSRGLIGMNFGCTMMPPTFHHDAITEAAIFSAKNIICPSFRFKDAFMEELAKEEPAKEHEEKAAVMTEIDGIGRLFGKEI